MKAPTARTLATIRVFACFAKGFPLSGRTFAFLVLFRYSLFTLPYIGTEARRTKRYFSVFSHIYVLRVYLLLSINCCIHDSSEDRVHADTVEPVLSGPVLSGHPLFSGQLSKSRKLLPLITVILTSIKRSRSPFAKSRRAVSIVLTCIKRPLCKRKPLKYYSSSYKYK